MANALRVGDHILERLGARAQAPEEVARMRPPRILAIALAALIAGSFAGRRARCRQARSGAPLQVTAVDTVGMTVSDMDRALAFYTGVLPFEKVSDVEVSGPASTSC